MDLADWVPQVALAAVVLWQGVLLLWAVRVARGEPEERLRQFAEDQSQEIRQRAEQGQTPDWQNCRAEAERFFEARGDRLRVIASAALAIGLFGTLGFLLLTLRLAPSRGDASLDTAELIGGTLLSLLGTFSGVVVHLIIVLFILRRAENRFEFWLQGFQTELRRVAGESPPQAAFLKNFQSSLDEIRDSLTSEFASSLAKAVAGFPDVVVKLQATVGDLAVAVEAQAVTVTSAMEQLSQSAASVARTGDTIHPIAERLADSNQTLARLPEELREVLDSTRQGWLRDLGEQQAKRLADLVVILDRGEQASRERETRMFETIRELQGLVAEVRQAVAGIAEGLAAEVEVMAGRLGTAFGQEARDATHDMLEVASKQQRMLLDRIEHHEEQWRNNIGTVVEELFHKIGGQVKESLTGDLSQAGKNLGEAAQTFAEVALALGEGHEAWSHAQSESLASWSKAAEQIDKAEQGLKAANAELLVAVGRLGSGASHLELIESMLKRLEEILEQQAEAIRECLGFLAEAA